MKDNNNIEDFFNQSMESFDNTPPAMVWDGIEKQLDRNVPFYKTLWFWGLFTLGLLIGVAAFYYIKNTQEKINGLLNENDIQKKEILEYKDQLMECSYRSIEAERIIESYSQIDQDSKKSNKKQIIKKQTPQKDIEQLNLEVANFKNKYEAPIIQEIKTISIEKIEEKRDSQIILKDEAIIENKKKVDPLIFTINPDDSLHQKIMIEGVKPDLTPKFIPKTKNWFNKTKDKIKDRKFFKRKKDRDK